MSDLKYSAFYYGYTITSNNYALDFSEGGPELMADIDIGDFSLTGLIAEVKTQLDATGSQEYTVSVDRDTREVTISAAGNFSLLPVTGSRAGISVLTLLGFLVDKTGSNSYTSDIPSGEAFFPQYPLESYIATKHWKESVSPSVSESSNGDVEIVDFGLKQFMQCNFKWINNYPQPKRSPFEENLTGEEDATAFLDFARTKKRIEFMFDRSNTAEFETLILESTPESNNGTGFKLKEDRKAVGFFETGILKFRKVS